MTTTNKIWETDNPPSAKWPPYTRGNVGEVFPEVVLPFGWDLIGQAAEGGWRDAFDRMGLVADGDFDPDETMVILSVFGGYCYINASDVRLLGVRAPGGDVATIDRSFFGGSAAPGYESKDGDTLLGGIGDIDSAAAAGAMWDLFPHRSRGRQPFPKCERLSTPATASSSTRRSPQPSCTPKVESAPRPR